MNKTSLLDEIFTKNLLDLKKEHTSKTAPRPEDLLNFYFGNSTLKSQVFAVFSALNEDTKQKFLAALASGLQQRNDPSTQQAIQTLLNLAQNLLNSQQQQQQIFKQYPQHPPTQHIVANQEDEFGEYSTVQANEPSNNQQKNDHDDFEDYAAAPQQDDVIPQQDDEFEEYKLANTLPLPKPNELNSVAKQFTPDPTLHSPNPTLLSLLPEYPPQPQLITYSNHQQPNLLEEEQKQPPQQDAEDDQFDEFIGTTEQQSEQPIPSKSKYNAFDVLADEQPLPLNTIAPEISMNQIDLHSMNLQKQDHLDLLGHTSQLPPQNNPVPYQIPPIENIQIDLKPKTSEDFQEFQVVPHSQNDLENGQQQNASETPVVNQGPKQIKYDLTSFEILHSINFANDYPLAQNEENKQLGGAIQLTSDIVQQIPRKQSKLSEEFEEFEEAPVFEAKVDAIELQNQGRNLIHGTQVNTEQPPENQVQEEIEEFENFAEATIENDRIEMADDKITDESSVKQIETIPEVVESVEDEKQAQKIEPSFKKIYEIDWGIDQANEVPDLKEQFASSQLVVPQPQISLSLSELYNLNKVEQTEEEKREEEEKSIPKEDGDEFEWSEVQNPLVTQQQLPPIDIPPQINSSVREQGKVVQETINLLGDFEGVQEQSQVVTQMKSQIKLIPRRSQWRDDLVKIIGLDTNSMQLMIEECLELELEMFIPILENYQKRVSLIYELNNEKRLAIEKENFEILPKLRDLLKEEEEKAKQLKQYVLNLMKLIDSMNQLQLSHHIETFCIQNQVTRNNVRCLRQMNFLQGMYCLDQLVPAPRLNLQEKFISAMQNEFSLILSLLKEAKVKFSDCLEKLLETKQFQTFLEGIQQLISIANQIKDQRLIVNIEEILIETNSFKVVYY